VGRYPICQFPSVEVVRLLLECGADPNTKDTSGDGNTPLHVTALGKANKPAVVAALLEGGAHFDGANRKDKTFEGMLRGQPVHEVVNVVQHTSLQCLAARAVKSHSIPYSDVLAKSMVEFVDMH